MRKRTAVYEMRREGWRDWWELHVSRTRREMDKHIREVDDGWVEPSDLEPTTLGLVHPLVQVDGPFALMFVCEEHCGSTVLAHESLHVAMAHERFVIRFGMAYGDDCGPNEERLAYYLGDVFAGAVKTLRENGHIE